MKTVLPLAAATLLAACVSPPDMPDATDPPLAGEALAARLAGHVVVLRPDGGAPEGEPEAVRISFAADGTGVMEPVGGPATIRIDDVIPIAIRLGPRPMTWQVVGQTLCIDGTDPGDCLPIRVQGDTLVIEDDGRPGRGRLVPV